MSDFEITLEDVQITADGGSVTIIDNLTSTRTDAALSANMGRQLQANINALTPGGATPPAGSINQIQVNAGGVFGTIIGLTAQRVGKTTYVAMGAYASDENADLQLGGSGQGTGTIHSGGSEMIYRGNPCTVDVQGNGPFTVRTGGTLRMTVDGVGLVTFVGTVIAPTATAGSNNTQVATTAFVTAAISALVNGAPTALDTLKEIADQLANDESVVNALILTVNTKEASANKATDFGTIDNVKFPTTQAVASYLVAQLAAKLDASQKGQANGVGTLAADGKQTASERRVQVWTVSGTPANTLGVDGDVAIDPTASPKMMYIPKAGGVWPAGFPLGSSAPAAPVVSAGANQNVAAGTTTGTLTGTATPPSGATISSVVWSQLSGPNTAAMATPTAYTTNISGLISGTYVFQFQATASNGGVGSGQTTFKVATAAQIISVTNWDGTGMNGRAYLPAGYDGSAAVPGVVYLHPSGQNGDQNSDNASIAETVPDSGLPYLLAQGQVCSMIVFWPQLHTGYWPGSKAVQARTKMLSLWNVDSTQIAVIGPSSGGGGALNAVNALPSGFSIAVALAPVANDATSGNAANFVNTKVKIVHGMQDTSSAPPAGSTFSNVPAILSGNPRYSPDVTMIFDEAHTSGLWSTYFLDKVMAPGNWEQLVLRFNNVPETAAQLHVAYAGTFGTFNAWAIAMMMVQKLSASSTKTTLLSTLAGIEQDDFYLVNMIADAGFTNFTSNTGPSTTVGNSVTGLKSIKNVSSSISLTYTSGSATVFTGGLAGEYLGLSSVMYAGGHRHTATGVYTLAGIGTGKRVDVFVYYGDKSTDATNFPMFSVDANGASQSQSYSNVWNTTRQVQLYDVPTDGSGNVVLTVYPGNATAGCNIIGIGFKVRTTTSVTLTASWVYGVTNPGVSGWNAVTGDPTTSVQLVTDSTTGIQLSTANTGLSYWTKFATYYWQDDADGAAGTYPSWIPSTLGKRTWFNYQTLYDSSVRNFNNVFTKSGGFTPGFYRIRIFGSTKTSHGSMPLITRYTVQIGDSGVVKVNLSVLNNTTRWVEVYGWITSDQQLVRISVAKSGSGEDLSFISMVQIQKFN